MTDPMYKRFSRVLRRSYPSIVATVALVVALVGVPGVTAGGLLVTTKQIKNNSITSADIKRSTLKTTDLGANAVRSADIQTGAVQSADIGAGEVEPQDVTMPDPTQIKEPDVAAANVGTDFAALPASGTFTKTDPSSVIELTWTGTAKAPSASCIFQLRIDGQAASDSSGLVYVAAVAENAIASISTTALFTGLATGDHMVEVWAKAQTSPGEQRPCIVGPGEAGIPQSFVVNEAVV